MVTLYLMKNSSLTLFLKGDKQVGYGYGMMGWIMGFFGMLVPITLLGIAVYLGVRFGIRDGLKHRK